MYDVMVRKLDDIHWREIQSLLNKVNRRGDKTHPWGVESGYVREDVTYSDQL